MRTSMLSLALALVAGSASADDADLAGIWMGKSAGLVIHEEGSGSFVGHPTDLKGTSDSTWNFNALGGSRFRFWILVFGGGGAEKLAECEITVDGDTLTLPIANARGKPGSMVFERVFVRIPSSIAGVKISFRAPSKKDPTPDQYVDRALRKAFVNAVTKAKAACSDLRRIQIGATAGSVTFRGKPHRRDVRAGLCIGAVNGVPIPRCGKGFAAAAERIEEGVYPVPKDEKYLLAAAALLLSLGVEEGVDRVVSPDLFASAGAPFMGWFLENRWRTLPGSLSLATWKETTWPAMVKAGKTGRAKEHVVVTVKVPRRRTRLKKVFDEKYDRR